MMLFEGSRWSINAGGRAMSANLNQAAKLCYTKKCFAPLHQTLPSLFTRSRVTQRSACAQTIGRVDNDFHWIVISNNPAISGLRTARARTFLLSGNGNQSFIHFIHLTGVLLDYSVSAMSLIVHG